MFAFFKNRKPELIKLSEPATEVLSVAEVKEFLRISGTAEDNTITNLIKASRIEAEKFMKISLIQQKWRLAYTNISDNEIELPIGPVISIDTVKLIDKNGDETVFSNQNYYLSPAKFFLFFDVIPSAKFIHIDYFAGYGTDANSVPQILKIAMLNQVAYRYENRGKSDIAPEAKNVFNLYRRINL